MTTKEMLYIKEQAVKHRAWAKEERAAAQAVPVEDGEYAYHINECHAHESAADALENIVGKFDQFETETVDVLGSVLATVEKRMYEYKAEALERLRKANPLTKPDTYEDDYAEYERLTHKAQALEEMLRIINAEMDGKEV